MAKTKHQKLANLMQAMLNAIDEHTAQVARQLDCVQLHFYERYALLGRPLMKGSAFRSMCFLHYIGLKILAPNPNLRAACHQLPMIGILLDRSVYLLSEYRQSSSKRLWFIPWGVHIVLPKENQEKLERSCAQALLFCPRVDEISNEIDWFEPEMAADSLTHQCLSILAYESQQAIVRQNLLKDPCPIWQRAKETWQNTECLTSDAPNIFYDVAKNPKKIDDADFAPQKGQSLALAYEGVLRSIRARSCRHRQALLSIYKEALERAMFENVPWSEREKIAFLHQWQDNFFKTGKLLDSKKPGRWKQCEGIDDVTASKFIKHFITEFIVNPKNKKLGEIACVLWILIWIAQEGPEGGINLKQVLQLSSKDIVEDSCAIIIDGIEVTISWGLWELLICLRGEGQGKRAHRLFNSLDASGKALECAMIDTSKELLPINADPVLPAAFLISPHIYKGTRMSSAERAAMRKVKPIIPFRHTHNNIKKELLKSQKRFSSAS